MIKLDVSKKLVDAHVNAVVGRIRQSFSEQTILAHVQALGAASIEDFIRAKPNEMKTWAYNSREKLQFGEFKEIYVKYFSNGVGKYVDGDYNAYRFLELLGVDVCPYCDDEFLDTIEIDGKKRRTCEIDHFFPKSVYPGLAMCIYNLVPSGQNCNGIKMEKEIGANPHEGDIENRTFLYPDLPVGIALDRITPEECIVKFHAKNGMEQNVDKLALEQRYKRHSSEAHRLLTNVQLYSPEKIDELVRMGFGTYEEVISTVFGPQHPEEKKQALRQKMLRDLTGY